MTSNFLELDIVLALQFFDEAIPTSQYHATAIVAVAGEEMGIGLLVHYLRQQQFSVQILPGPCTQGTPKGVRLDRWIRTIRDGKITFYQIEVKNWSAHAIGGRVLSVNVSPLELATHKIERWRQEWDGITFRKSGARKVLTPMKPPEPNCHVEPLICYWDAMHNQGNREPLFFVEIQHSPFSHVGVFSMSAYLRELLTAGITQITLDMPQTFQRMQWLTRLFTSQ